MDEAALAVALPTHERRRTDHVGYCSSLEVLIENAPLAGPLRWGRVEILRPCYHRPFCHRQIKNDIQGIAGRVVFHLTEKRGCRNLGELLLISLVIGLVI